MLQKRPLLLLKQYSQKPKLNQTLEKSVHFIISPGNLPNESIDTYGEWSSKSLGDNSIDQSFCMGVRSAITEKHLISGDTVEKDEVEFTFTHAELVKGLPREISL